MIMSFLTDRKLNNYRRLITALLIFKYYVDYDSVREPKALFIRQII